ncbi:MAG TPA: fibro-slime domain-containing protein [Candidatus Acidoferrales bacterium]|jgi:fibro-slime domain-containing protein|nr:fibro-slime domain-containing protein [Candidatus Acidoferrales bacterium]
MLLLLKATAGFAQSTINLQVDYWDFLYSGTAPGTYGGHAGAGHPDFDAYVSSTGVADGLVQNNLGANGLPIFASSTGTASTTQITSAASFAQWYQTTPGTNVYVPGTLTLTNTSVGVFQSSGIDFFPLDGQGFNSDGSQGDSACDLSGPHNFCFATHIKFTTKLNNSSATITVTGGNDIWIFINGTLVIDLGGDHSPITGTWSALSAAMVALGLSYGQTVTVDIFQAQRHTCGSNFTLTLSNLANITSALPPTVGIVKAGSQVQLTCEGILQQSTDLVHWQDVNPQVSSPYSFTPTNSVFFRARR